MGWAAFAEIQRGPKSKLLGIFWVVGFRSIVCWNMCRSMHRIFKMFCKRFWFMKSCFCGRSTTRCPKFLPRRLFWFGSGISSPALSGRIKKCCMLASSLALDFSRTQIPVPSNRQKYLWLLVDFSTWRKWEERNRKSGHGSNFGSRRRKNRRFANFLPKTIPISIRPFWKFVSQLRKLVGSLS